MKALSLSKSTPRRSQGNRLCAFFIASTTSEPSRVSSGRHSVQPVAISTKGLDERSRHRRAAMGHHVDLAEAWRRTVPVIERADGNFPPDGRIESDTARRLPPLAARFASPSRRSIVAALIARPRSRSAWPSFNRPCCSRADSKIGIITLSRLPHTRSDASHNAVNASLIVAPYLRRRSRGASTPLGPTGACWSCSAAGVRIVIVGAGSRLRARMLRITSAEWTF
jgi:hypothetical protein